LDKPVVPKTSEIPTAASHEPEVHPVDKSRDQLVGKAGDVSFPLADEVVERNPPAWADLDLLCVGPLDNRNSVGQRGFVERYRVSRLLWNADAPLPSSICSHLGIVTAACDHDQHALKRNTLVLDVAADPERLIFTDNVSESRGCAEQRGGCKKRSKDNE
jgi:hypothetical protein